MTLLSRSATGAPRRRGVTLAAVLAVGGLAAGCSGDDDSGPDLPVVDVGGDLVGTCLDFPDDTGTDIGSLPSVDCAEEHTHQVIAVVESEAETYPGTAQLEAEAQTACIAEFEGFVGINPFDSELFTVWLVPTLASWDRADDREIICMVGNHNGAPLVGSVRDAAR